MTEPNVDPTRATLETYRALRVGLVGAGGLLLIALALHIIAVGKIPGSISATYYTPVRGVFVGSLVATGLALVAIKGRSTWEDGMLNLAGGFIPLVAFVPTPVRVRSIVGADDFYTCPDPGSSCVPRQVINGVANNVSAYALITGALLVMVWAWLLRARRRGSPWSTTTRVGLLVSTALWALFTGWFLLAPDGFTRFAHYASAVVFFGMLIVVVWLNGWYLNSSGRRADLVGMSREGYQRWYYAIAVSMLLALGAGLALFLATGDQNALPLVFWLEVVLLALFMTFWVLQTLEHWNTGIPEPAATPTREEIKIARIHRRAM